MGRRPVVALVALVTVILVVVVVALESGPAGRPADQFDVPLPSVAALTTRPYVRDLLDDMRTSYGTVGVNEMPIWTVGPHQPAVHVTVAPGCNDFTSDTGSMIPIPKQATTLRHGDSPIIVDQPSTSSDWELWQAQRAPDGAWEACWGGRLDTATSNGVFPSPWGLSASGISYLATAITERDVGSGRIDHAIAVDLPGCTRPQIAPAVRNDCSVDSGQPPYGTRFRFPPDLRVPAGLTAFGRMVFRAVQRYGMVFTDQAGAVMLQAEDSSDWAAQGHTGPNPMVASWDGQPEYRVVADLPWRDLTVVAGR